MSVPRQEKHVRKMCYSLLSSRHEVESQNGHAILRTKDAFASSLAGVASCMGQPPKAADAGKKGRLKGANFYSNIPLVLMNGGPSAKVN